MKGNILENIKNFAIGAGKKIKGGVNLVVKEINEVLETSNNETNKRSKTTVDYYKVVEEIIKNESMFDNTKQELIKTLMKDATPEYYEAVLTIIKSDMFDSKMIKLVKTIS